MAATQQPPALSHSLTENGSHRSVQPFLSPLQLTPEVMGNSPQSSPLPLEVINQIYGHEVTDLTPSSLGAISKLPQNHLSHEAHPLGPNVLMDDLFLKFSMLLERGLSQTAAKITNDLKGDFQALGSRIEAIESKMEETVAATSQNSGQIQTLQDQLEVALSRIDDLENRSRRSNIRIRGLPETILNVPEAVQDLIKYLIPSVAPQHLELDRAHRALGPPRKDGSPRDIIAKPHHYSIKEEVMRQARSNQNIMCQGHQVQLFADLSPSTIQRRRSLKPLLLALTQKAIRYKWSFPFAVKFTFNGKPYAFSTFPEGEVLLLRLKIIAQEADMDTSNAGQGSNKRAIPTSPPTPLWKKNRNKKSRDEGTT